MNTICDAYQWNIGLGQGSRRSLPGGDGSVSIYMPEEEKVGGLAPGDRRMSQGRGPRVQPGRFIVGCFIRFHIHISIRIENHNIFIHSPLLMIYFLYFYVIYLG